MRRSHTARHVHFSKRRALAPRATVSLRGAPREQHGGITLCGRHLHVTLSKRSQHFSVKTPPAYSPACKDAAGYPLTVDRPPACNGCRLVTVVPDAKADRSPAHRRAVGHYVFTFTRKNSRAPRYHSDGHRHTSRRAAAQVRWLTAADKNTASATIAGSLRKIAPSISIRIATIIRRRRTALECIRCSHFRDKLPHQLHAGRRDRLHR